MGNAPVKDSKPITSEEIHPVNEAKIISVKEYVVNNNHEEMKFNTESDNQKNNSTSRDIELYCKRLVSCQFIGQTNLDSEKCTDQKLIKTKLNLGFYLKLLDQIIRESEPSEFTGDDEEYIQILNMVAVRRKREGEKTAECFQRLCDDNKRFVEVYRSRGKKSEVMKTKLYWGTKQQLLSGKVIADWVDVNGPLDPIFGVLLQPSAGRVGPGDTGIIHKVLFDQNGHMAYHSASHDAFGYLFMSHKVGPGYDYLGKNSLECDNCMAGQLTGIDFWKRVLRDRDCTSCLPGLHEAKNTKL